MINGSYWLGAAGGAVASIALLDTALFAADLGWRLAFGIGAALGVGILLVRRNVPESPRWLFIHGREEEAEAIVGDIEQAVEGETGEQLSEVDDSLTVKQRKRIPLGEIARTAFTKYPRRTALGFALFIGQAFMYNAVTFDLGTLLGEFFDVASGTVPIYIAIFALSNFLGPLVLGRFFDTVGRKPMVTLTYLGSAALTTVLAILLLGNSLTTWSFMALVLAIFFLASAGASSAYLTVSEIFPMETRALSIAFFYAVGTGAGGIVGPLLFGHLIASGSQDQVATGFFIGAVVMAIGGIAELLFGVRAEQKQLEDIATPLTAEGEEVKDEETEEPQPAPRPVVEPDGVMTGRSRGMPLWSPAAPRTDRDREIEIIVRALNEHGDTTSRKELARTVGGRYWGPGRFQGALREAVTEGRVRRVRNDQYAPK
jgi:MFS family permease